MSGISDPRNLTAFLSRVVFVRQPPLCLRFDFQRIGLRAVGGGDQFIMGILDFAEARGFLRGVICD